MRAHAGEAGLEAERTDDFVVAVNELATNSVCHGGGRGVLTIWSDERSIVCDVADEGCFGDPLVGRVRPPAGSPRGHGLWIANHVCDLVQIRSFATGSVVRLHLDVG